MSKFDLAAARKSGYSDSEILDGLAAEQPKFDLKAARAAGYDDTTILGGLAEQDFGKTRFETIKDAGIQAVRNIGNAFLPDAPEAKPAAARGVTVAASPAAPQAAPYDFAALNGAEPQPPAIEQPTGASIVEANKRPQDKAREAAAAVPVPTLTPEYGFDQAGVDLRRDQENAAGAALRQRRAAELRKQVPNIDERTLSNIVEQEIITGGRTNPGTVSASEFDFDTHDQYQDAGTIERGAARGVNAIKQQAAGLHEFIGDTIGADGYSNAMADTGKQLDNEAAAIGDRSQYLTRNWEGAVSSIVSQTPGLAVAALSGGSIPLLMMGAQTFGDEYQTGKAAGLSYAERTTRAGINGVAEIIGERIGMPSFAKVFRDITKGAPTDQLLKDLAKHVMAEVPGEQLTTAIQFSNDKFAPYGLNQEAGLKEYLGQAADTLVQTVMQAGAMGSVGIAKNLPQARSDQSSTVAADVAKDNALSQWDRAFKNPAAAGVTAAPVAAPKPAGGLARAAAVAAQTGVMQQAAADQAIDATDLLETEGAADAGGRPAEPNAVGDQARGDVAPGSPGVAPVGLPEGGNELAGALAAGGGAAVAAGNALPAGDPLAADSSGEQNTESDTQAALPVTGETQPIARVGSTPKATEDVTVRDGVVYLGKYPAQNFETGDDITVADSSFEAVSQALRDGGALSSKQRIYGGPAAQPAAKGSNPYKRAFETLTAGSLPQGVANPEIAKAAFDAGKIKSAGDLRRFEEHGYPAAFAAAAPVATPKASPKKTLPPAKTADEFAERARKEFVKLIKDMGGIGTVEAKDITGEPAHIANRMASGLFRTDGNALDLVARRLNEAGYLSDEAYNDVDGGVQAVRELVNQALGKEAVMTAADQERYNELAAIEQSLEEDMPARNEALADMIYAETIDDDLPDFGTGSTDTAADMRAMGFSETEIADALNSENARNEEYDTQGKHHQSPEESSAQGSEAGNRAGQNQDAEAVFGLESQTPAGLKSKAEAAKQQADAKAKSEAEAESKQKADAERDSFTLSGSDRTSDANAGQGDIFGQPASNEADKASQAYTPPTTTKEASARWEYGTERGANQNTLFAAVSKALDAKLFYTRDVLDFVAKDLGITDEQRKVGADKVEGGAFGYDVYHARQAVEKERAAKANTEAGKRLGLKVGENIGKIKLNDGKVASAATVEVVSKTDVTLIAKRGPQTIRVTIPHANIERYVEDAGNTYLKDKQVTPEDRLARAGPVDTGLFAEKPTKLDAAAASIDTELDAALKELADALKKQSGQLNAGVDPAILALGVKVGSLYVAKGVVKFAQYSKAIIDALRAHGVSADQIKPYLKQFYAATKQAVDDATFDKMDDDRTVRGFDLDALGEQKQDQSVDAVSQAAPESTAIAGVKQMLVEFGGQRYPVDSFADASRKWLAFSEQTNAGVSEIGNGIPIYDQTGKQIARVSYNGKVWAGAEYVAGAEPIYSPTAERPAEKEVQEEAPAKLANATAPEHVTTGVDDRELGEIVAEFNSAQESMNDGGDEQVTHVFDKPAKGEIVRLADKAKVYHKDHGWMTVEQAKARIAEWKDKAYAQGGAEAYNNGNAQRIVLSLFDMTGSWSKPWEEAGYQVFRFDIQNDPDMGDVNKFSTEFFNDNFGAFEGQDIYAILAACPCTDFAVSGARHFAAKDADGRTVASVKLVHQALNTIEYFKPAVWAIENPVGRIEKLGGLPPWRLAFDPNQLGDPYTKKTLLWGRFNADLPIAPVEATEGSKMHKLYGGKSLATKNARSATPEGFSYGFFMANNAVDNPVMAVANKYDRLDRGVIKTALDAGVTEAQISEAVDDFYYGDLDDDAANDAIRALEPDTPPAKKTLQQLTDEALAGTAPLSPADKLRSQADALTKEAQKMMGGIEPGQPVRSTADRNKRDKAMEKMSKSADLLRQADDIDAGGTEAAQDKAPVADTIDWGGMSAEQREELVIKAGWSAGRDNHISATGRRIAAAAWDGLETQTRLTLKSYEENGRGMTYTEQQAALGNEQGRNSFTLDRLNRDTDQMESVTFARGEYVRYTLSGKDVFGEIDGISHARNEFSVDGLWYPFGFAYKTEKPAAAEKPTVPMSSVIDAVNKKHGADLGYADRIHTTVVHADLFERVAAGEVTADEFKASFDALLKNKSGVTAELVAMTKDAIFKQYPGLVYRYKNDKKADVVEAAFRDMVDDFTLGEGYSYGMSSGSRTDSIRAIVDRTTDQTLADRAEAIKQATEERAASRKEAEAGMDDPQTLDDFQRLMAARAREIGGTVTYQQVRMTLTPEQRERFDVLAAEKSRGARAASKDAEQAHSIRAHGEAVETTDIIKTRHTKHGHDLWQFNLVERVAGEEFKSLVGQAKRLGGDYSSYRGNGAIPGWQFRTEEAAIAFKALVAGDTTQARDVMQTRRDAYADDRSQTAVERLTEMADSLEGKADASLGQERKANTDKRARQAASAERAANSDKAMARTMRNIAGAIENGTAKMLDRVRQKVQVETLYGFVNTAQSDKLRALYQSYADQQKHEGEKPNAETADYVTFPNYTAFRSDLASLGRALLETDGTKKIGQQIMKVADDVSAAYLKFAKDNLGKVATFSTKGGGSASFPSKAIAEAAIQRSGYKGAAIVLPVSRGVNTIILSPSEAIKRGVWDGDNDKRITLNADLGAEIVEKLARAKSRSTRETSPWQFNSAYDKRKRLAGMGIETPAELRAAVREFIALREAPKEADKIKEMERAMIGRRNDGMDFFPTPASIADEMVETAGIQPGMGVLEPSAGMGHIAERIRAAGVDPDVVELSNERKELLEAKGFRVVGRDFMDIKPREFFTFGDTFRDKDGTEGVMRGLGGMGSNRVRLVVNGDERTARYTDRDGLTPVSKNGTDSGYDRILMNPPFGDRRDAAHVQHAYKLLKPGGRIVAIMGEGVFFGSDKKAQAFRDWLEKVGATDEKLDEGTFLDPSLPVNTGTNARMVVIDKPGADIVAVSEPTDTGTAMFNRGNESHGLPVESVQQTVDAMTADWKNAPAIVIAADMNDPAIPQKVRDEDTKQKSHGANGEPDGFIYHGTVYLIAGQLRTEADVARVLAHEALGHAGLRGLYGEALAPILRQITALRSKEVAAKARQYGLDVKNEKDRMTAAEEVLAEMAQRTPELGFVKRAIAAIRQWLRDHGLKLGLTDADIIATFLLPARRYITDGSFRNPSRASGLGASSYQAESNELVSDGARSDAKIITDLARSKAFIEKGYGGIDAPTRMMVQGAMLRLAKNHKVLNSIVELIPVDVVNMLARKQLTPNMLLNNEPMLKDLLPIDGNKPVSINSRASSALIRAAASAAAKHIPIDGFGMNFGSSSTTVGATKGNALLGDKFTSANLATTDVGADGVSQSGRGNVETGSTNGAFGGWQGNAPSNKDDIIQQENGFNAAPAFMLGDSLAAKAWRMLAGDPIVFQNPMPDSFDMESAAREIDPGMRAQNDPLDLEEEKYLAKKWHVKMPDGTHAYVMENKQGEVWLDASRLNTTSSAGTKLYLLVGSYAEGNGKVFIGDPAGLSDAALIRRTENMLSLALRFGRTDFMRPHEYQMNPYANQGSSKLMSVVRPINWVEGDDANNIDELIKTSHANTLATTPGIRDVVYNFEHGRFERNGAEFTDQDFAALAPQRNAPRTSAVAISGGAGRSATLKRAAVTNTLARATSSEARGRLLADIGAVVSRPGGLEGSPLADILYSRQSTIPGTTTPQPQQITVQPPLGLPPGFSGNQASWDAPENTGFDNLVYKLQNKHIDTKRVIEAVQKAGAQLADKWNPYLQEELFHGRAAKRTLDFVERELNPLLTDAKARGLTLDEIDQYLHARHAEEANDLIAGRDPKMQDGGSGMTTADARAYLAGLSADQARDLAAVAARVDAILAATRRMYADYGLESIDTVDEWGTMFKHYVPLMREDHDGAMGIGQGFSIKGREVKHRTGSTRAVVDILANIALQREKVIVRGEKNRVAVSLAGLAKLNPNADFWTFDKVPTERVLNEKTGLVESRPDPMFKSRDNVIVAKIKGKNGKVEERAIVFNESNERAMRMALSLKNLDVAQLEGVMGVSAKITRYFASINTQYNPVFGFVNLTRDVQGALLNLNTTPLKHRKAAILAHTFTALSGIYRDARAERRGGMARSPWTVLWEEFNQEGGQTGYRDLFATSEDRANKIRHALNPTAWMDNKLGKFFTAGGTLKVPLAVAQKGAGWIFDWLSDFNLTMENAVRLSAYKVGLEQGMSKQQAASLAKNLTVNFNRRGMAGQQAGALYAFFNASMQGTARIAATLTTMEPGRINTMRLSGAGKAIIGGGMLLGAMQAVMLAAMGFDDDEPPEFVRERNLIIPIGGKDYITIPMPLGYHAIPNFGRVLAEIAMDGGDNAGKRLFGLFGVVAEAFNPLGGTLSLQTISPTALDPFVALATNEDWTGKPIAREDFSSMEPTPGFTRTKDTASSYAKALAEAINYATGGTDYTPGAMSPTPDQIDYLVAQITGGVGREIGKTEQTITALATGEELPTYKIPLLGRYYGSSEGQAGQAGKFYGNLKEAKQHHGELKGRRDDGLPVDDYLDANPDADYLAKQGNKADTRIKALRRRKLKLIQDGAPREDIKDIEARITEAMEDFNADVAAAE